MNLKVAANQSAIQYNMLGLAASLQVAYKKTKELYEKKEKQQAENLKSEFVGTVGERKDFSLIVKKIFSFENQFGISYIISMNDKDGNIFIWKTSNFNLEEKSSYILKGTIKEHAEYKGTKQTVISRCKIVK